MHQADILTSMSGKGLADAMRRSCRKRLLAGCLAAPVLALTALALPIVLLLLRGCSAPDAPPPLMDRDGRIVLYHGVNVSNFAKAAPDFMPWQSAEDFAQLRNWGFNLVRFLIFWEAVEPSPGVYDDVYIDAVLERVRWLEALGIDVLLDLHQDLYSRRFTGNGFPEWTVNDGGHVFTPREPWNLNYLSPAVRAAYRHFWLSEELRGRYIAMAAHVLRSVKDCDNVIGLDLMNEPWPAPFWGFERRVLSRFYADIHEMRRREGLTTPLFFEPVIYTSAGWSSRLRFSPAVDSVYAPHYYDPWCHQGRPYSALGKRLMRTGLHIKMKEARRFGVPLLYGELGIAPETEGYGAFLDDFLGLLRERHIGWTCYSLDKQGHSGFALLDEHGAPQEALLKHYVSVYPQRVAGRNLKTDYGVDYMRIAYDPIVSRRPTVVAIPKRCEQARVYVNGCEAVYDSLRRCFEHTSRPEEGRQTIEVHWRQP